MPRKLKSKKKKTFVELNETINAIPAGVYRLESRDENGAKLWVGDKIFVGLIGDVEEYLQDLSEREGRTRRMREEDFVDQYYDLLKGLKGTLPDWTRPFTCCALDPSLARELQ